MADNDNPEVEGPAPSDIRPISLIDEMKRSYLDYAMSVIVSRALPDVRDGLKPVHRRILFSMHENNYTPDRPYNKSARVTGDTMGKYHPHGNQAIYDALVRLAQEFSMRLPLIDGQGNFGSVDGDPPAAERYTEVRLARPAMSLLDDLENDTVDFQPNYDGREREPVVLPAKFPNLLVNGAGGIAVGMATNIPPHNLGEVIDACIAYLDNPAIGIEELVEIVPGPDFPTGGLILGRTGIRSAYHKGRGSILMRGRVTTETVRKEREALIITEIPYQVNKAAMVEKIAELVREKRIEGIADIRDESDRQGMRVVIELKRDAMADVVLNQLYRFSPLQSHLRLQHGGADRRQAGAAQSQGHDPRLHRVPRGGDRPPHQVPAAQGARPRPCPGRPGHRRRQYRRGHRRDPQSARSGHGARAVDGPRLAGQGRGRAGRADRRPAPQSVGQRHLPPVRGAGPRHPRSPPPAAHRARPRRGRRRAEEARRADRRLSRHLALPRPHRVDRQGRADGDQDRVRHAAPHRDHSRWKARSRTRT